MSRRLADARSGQAPREPAAEIPSKARDLKLDTPGDETSDSRTSVMPKNKALMRIAVDTGGTFTDCVFLRDGEPQVLKVFSTPADPSRAIIEAIREIAPASSPEVRHGTTVGTNTLLERTGARVAFVTTAGFEDTAAIGRQARANLYDWFFTPAPPLAPSELRFGVRERISAEGEVLRGPSSERDTH